MKRTLFTKLFAAVLLLSAISVAGQGTYNINLTDTKDREEINFVGSEHNVQVCGLEEGRTYQVWAVKHGCSPKVKLVGPSQFATTFTFQATAGCMNFVLQKDESSPACAAGTVWFSIGCTNCDKKGNDPFGKIAMSGGASPEFLIEDVFIGGGCFDITNVVGIGEPGGRGTFVDGGSTILLNDGVALCTGDVGIGNGPNNSNGAGTNIGGPTSDPDLDLLTGGNLFNVQGIEFDFQPTIPSISFQYVFASEEYCEYVNSGFNDVFGFFISGPGISGGFSYNGQNIAVLPSSGIFVSINNVNHLTNTGYFVPNQDNCGGTTNMNDIQYDGWTQVLVAVANVVPCETYHIRLVISDVGDGIFDSGVFLGSGTFNAGGTATGEAFAASTGSNVVYESCDDGSYIFTRAGGSNSLPLTLNFTLLPSSTATPGVDYVPFPLTITIPPGSDQYVLPVDVIADNIPEGVETIILSLTNACSCSSLQIELEIHDPPPVMLDLPDMEVCAGSPVSIEAMPTGGIPNTNFTYLWSNGGTGSTLVAAPTFNTSYTVTVTDDCGGTASATTNIQVAELPTANIVGGGVLCTSNPNSSVQLTVELTGTPNWILTYAINGQPQTPVLVTSSPYIFDTNIPGIYTLAAVSSVIGDCAGPVTGVAIVDLVTLDVPVQTTPYTCTQFGTMTALPNGGTAPYNYVWSNGFPNFETALGLTPGIYFVTVTDDNGCTSSASGIVGTPPVLNTSATGSQVNCVDPLGGTVTLTVTGGTAPYTFLWSTGDSGQNLTGVGAGVYQVTVTDMDGCVSLAEATVVANVDLPLAIAQAPDDLDCNNQVVLVSGQGSEIGSGITYYWTGPGISGPDTEIDVNVQIDGLYTILVTNTANGCTSTASVLVSSNLTPPTSVAVGDTLSCNTNSIDISGVGSSTGPNFQYQWFGPGIINGINTLTPEVNQAGTYTLVVTDNLNGCTSSADAEVFNDTNAPLSNIAAPFPLTCIVNSITLDGSSSSNGPNYNYQWLLNNVAIPGADGLSITANTTGTYQIVVTNILNGCTSSYSTQVVNDLAAPVVNATAAGQITCTVNSVALNSTVQGNPANYTFEWSSTNGTFTGPTNTANSSAGTPGLYQVLVTNISNGCTSTASVQVTQDASIPVVQLTSSGNIDCIETLVQLSGNGSSQSPSITYNWTTVGGNFQSGQNTLNPVVNQPGVYTLTLFDTSNNCENQSSITVTEDNLPPAITMPAPLTLDCDDTQAILAASVSNVPANATLNYNWTTLDGLINGPANILTPTISDPGTYNLVVTNTENGCTSQASIVIDENVTPPVVVIANPDILTCTSNTVALNATGTSTGISFQYLWSSASGSFVTNNDILNPVVDAPGTYNLLVTNSLNSCTATQSIVVTEDVQPPTAIAGAPVTLNCEFTTLNLNGTGSSVGQAFQYAWTGPGIVDDETTLNPLVNEPGTYQLLVTNTTNNCQTTATVVVNQDITPPLAVAGTGGELSCTLTSMTLDGTGSSFGNNIQYEWSSPNGNISTGGNTLNPTINAPGDYFITVTNNINGCTSTDMVVITEDDDLPAVETSVSQPITCLVTEVILDGSGSAVGPEFTYLWSTNNGNIFSGETTLNPVVTEAGIYLLTVTNTATNCSNIASVTVLAQTDPPAVEAGMPDQLTCTELTLNLNGNGSASGTGFTYEWSTSNGNIVSGENTINPTVDEPGTYTLLVTNTATGCTSSDQVVISESLNAPVAVASTPGVLTCATNSLILSGTGSSTGTTFSYLWSTADGNILNGGSTLTPTINQPGTYSLLVTNSLNGCTETESVVVSQDIIDPTAEAGTANQLSCTENTVTLNGNGSSTGSAFTYQWATNNGNILNGASTLTPTVNQTGNYILTVTNTVNGCTSTDNVIVTQDNSLPQVAVVQPATLNCNMTELTVIATASQGAIFDYLWTATNGGNIVSGGTSLLPVINQPGTYTLIVTNTTNGCTNTAQTVVNQNITTPNADAGQPYILDCFEALNYLDGSASSANGQLSYGWSTQDGNVIAGANTANPSISEPGTYILAVTDLTNGCTDIDQVIITRDLPVVTPLANQPPCFGDKGSIVLSGVTGGEPPYLYSINDGDQFATHTLFTNLEPGMYSVIVQDANGCEYNEEVEIEEPSLFEIEVEPQITVQLGDSYQINTLVNYPLTEIAQVEWFPGINLSCTDCLDPIITPTSAMVYNVTVVTENGCKDSAPLLVIVEKSGGVYVPSAFSPNGDGNNDVFMIFSDPKSVSKVKSFFVYNRWGESVYQYFNFLPNNPAFGWDGKHRGQTLNPAVFAWFAEVEFVDGSVEIFKGDVTLTK